MLLDVGGTFLTGHCVAMTWFPQEPIDAVTCCIQHSRVIELGNIGDRTIAQQHDIPETSSLSGHKWTQQMKKKSWIPQQEAQLQEKSVAEIINLFVGDLFGTGVLTRLRTDFQVGSEDWNDETCTGQRKGWRQNPQTRPYIEVCQERSSMGSHWNETRRKTSNALLQCIRCIEAFWDRQIGCRVRHNSNVATSSPDVLQWNLHQQLAM